MRKILTILLLFASLIASAQSSPSKVIRVNGTAATFGSNVAVGTIILDTSGGTAYMTLLPLVSTKTIATCTVGTDIKTLGGSSTTLNAYKGTIAVTTQTIPITWPSAFASTDYFLNVRAYFVQTVGGKSVQVDNAVYNFSKTTTGCTLSVDSIAGFIEYLAVDNTNLYPLAMTNYVATSAVTTSVGSPGSDILIPSEKAVRTAITAAISTESDPVVKAISGLVKSNGTTISAAVSGTDYLAPSAITTSVGSPGSNSLIPSEQAVRTAISSAIPTESDPIVKAINGVVKSNGTTISAAVSGTDFLAPSATTNIGTTAHALNRTSGAETLSGITLTTPDIGAATGTSLAATGAITSSGGGIGYTTGAGGTVTQLTSRATSVTLNKLCGTITMFSAAVAAAGISTFNLVNSFIAATDIVLVKHNSGFNACAFQCEAIPAAGSAQINVKNISSASITEATPLQFIVIKAATN